MKTLKDDIREIVSSALEIYAVNDNSYIRDGLVTGSTNKLLSAFQAAMERCVPEISDYEKSIIGLTSYDYQNKHRTQVLENIKKEI